MTSSKYLTLFQAAQAVLIDNDLGQSTKPAPRLYPHQWNWDSAFIAIGLSHVDENRAQLEIRSLLRAQWKNGMVPHIVFNADAGEYHPGPDYWGRTIEEMPTHVRTSGITQPPILAHAAHRVYLNSRDKNSGLTFLQEIFPALCHYSIYLLEQRAVNNDGLSVIYHPWESGMDNASSWDRPLSALELDHEPVFQRHDNSIVPPSERPSNNQYRRYSYLVERYAAVDWAANRINEIALFRMQSILFNSLHLRSLKSLVEIAKIVDTPLPNSLQGAAESLATAMDSVIWDEGQLCYCDRNLQDGTFHGVNNLAQFSPLFAALPTSQRAGQLIQTLQSQEFWPDDGWGICSESRNSPSYESRCYWRGPVWVNMNWMIIQGLKAYGYHDLAAKLGAETIQLVQQNGFYEYFNPETGDGLGSNSFSWTAALVIDLLASGYG